MPTRKMRKSHPSTESIGTGPDRDRSWRRALLAWLCGLSRYRTFAALSALAASSTAGRPAERATSDAAAGTALQRPTGKPARSVNVAVLGVHRLAFNRDGIGIHTLSTPGMLTQTDGSTLLVCIGRGVAASHSVPSDTKGNAYVQLGATRAYSLWPKSGTALYACEKAAGGRGHAVIAAKPVASDETTISVVEVINGGVVSDFRWSEVLKDRATTSPGVTTTGPALLVAWWWGDGGARFDKTAVPDNGFTVIDGVLLSGNLVQCAVAARRVEAAGTYHVTWTSTPVQGAQLWIAAVQSSP